MSRHREAAVFPLRVKLFFPIIADYEEKSTVKNLKIVSFPTEGPGFLQFYTECGMILS